ncbi:hypothetical protein B9Z55_015710 [Caenorhabditis nigoni]|uniref:JmjC domain-containing protein n=1 Tax=Caenorhabditis nigoni TaxID=1611254 RepID=A0A2G5UBH0_9PELO|nr:hypothetical protein B9Z55_015710 [Caenorhabditis nigoni]
MQLLIEPPDHKLNFLQNDNVFFFRFNFSFIFPLLVGETLDKSEHNRLTGYGSGSTAVVKCHVITDGFPVFTIKTADGRTLVGNDAELRILDQLPSFMQATNRGNLLAHVHEDVFGVNKVQLYSKFIGSLTAAHMENSLMASINWNVGPASCIWYAIPYEYRKQIEV